MRSRRAPLARLGEFLALAVDWVALLALMVLAARWSGNFPSAQNYAVAGVLLLIVVPGMLAPGWQGIARRSSATWLVPALVALRPAALLAVPLVGGIPGVLLAVVLLRMLAIPACPTPRSIPCGARFDQWARQWLRSTFAAALIGAGALALVVSLVGNAGSRVTAGLWLAAGGYAASATAIAVGRRGADIRSSRSVGDPSTTSQGAVSPVPPEAAARAALQTVIACAGAAGAAAAVSYSVVVGAGGGPVLFALVVAGISAGGLLGLLPMQAVRRRLSVVTAGCGAVVLAGVTTGAMALVGSAGPLVLLAASMGVFTGLALGAGQVVVASLTHHQQARVMAVGRRGVRVAFAAGVAVAPLVAGVLGGDQLGLGDAVIDVDGSAVVLVIAALLLATTGVAAYGQSGDGTDISLWRSVLRAFRAEGGRVTLPGTLIALEGGDGAGKSTQARLLAEWLAEQGVDVLLTREPGATEVGASIRSLVLDPENEAMSDRTEALLYAADRAEHVDKQILPALRAGRVVVTDRYVDSSIAYQGAGRQLGNDPVADISRWATQGVAPQLTVVLDIPPGTGLARLSTAADRLEREPADFHARVRQAFLERAAGRSDYVVLDATKPAQRLQRQLRARVGHLLGLRDRILDHDDLDDDLDDAPDDAPEHHARDQGTRDHDARDVGTAVPARSHAQPGTRK